MANTSEEILAELRRKAAAKAAATPTTTVNRSSAWIPVSNWNMAPSVRAANAKKPAGPAPAPAATTLTTVKKTGTTPAVQRDRAEPIQSVRRPTTTAAPDSGIQTVAARAGAFSPRQEPDMETVRATRQPRPAVQQAPRPYTLEQFQALGVQKSGIAVPEPGDVWSEMMRNVRDSGLFQRQRTILPDAPGGEVIESGKYAGFPRYGNQNQAVPGLNGWQPPNDDGLRAAADKLRGLDPIADRQVELARRRQTANYIAESGVTTHPELFRRMLSDEASAQKGYKGWEALLDKGGDWLETVFLNDQWWKSLRLDDALKVLGPLPPAMMAREMIKQSGNAMLGAAGAPEGTDFGSLTMPQAASIYSGPIGAVINPWSPDSVWAGTTKWLTQGQSEAARLGRTGDNWLPSIQAGGRGAIVGATFMPLYTMWKGWANGGNEAVQFLENNRRMQEAPPEVRNYLNMATLNPNMGTGAQPQRETIDELEDKYNTPLIRADGDRLLQQSQGLEQQAITALAAGDAAKAALLRTQAGQAAAAAAARYGRANELDAMTWDDIIYRRQDKLGELAWGMAYDPATAIDPWVDKAFGAIGRGIKELWRLPKKPAGLQDLAKAVQEGYQIAGALEAGLDVTKLSKRGNVLAPNWDIFQASPLESIGNWFKYMVQRTPESEAHKTASMLLGAMSRAFNGVDNVADARRILDTMLSEPQKLVSGLDGLVGDYFKATGGVLRVGQDVLLDTEMVRRMPVMQVAADALRKATALADPKQTLDVPKLWAEFDSALYKATRRVLGASAIDDLPIGAASMQVLKFGPKAISPGATVKIDAGYGRVVSVDEVAQTVTVQPLSPVARPVTVPISKATALEVATGGDARRVVKGSLVTTPQGIGVVEDVKYLPGGGGKSIAVRHGDQVMTHLDTEVQLYAPVRAQGERAAILFKDKDGKDIATTTLMSPQEAKLYEKHLNAAIKAGFGDKIMKAVNAVTAVQRGFLSDQWLNLRPGHWIRNAVSATAALMGDGIYSIETLPTILDDFGKFFPGSFPTERIMKAVTNTDNAEHWTRTTLRWQSKNPYAAANEALNEIWTGMTSVLGRVPFGEQAFYVRAFHKAFMRSLGQAWGTTVERTLDEWLRTYGATDAFRREVVEAIKAEGARNGKDVVRTTLSRMLASKWKEPTLRGMGIPAEVLSIDAELRIESLLREWQRNSRRVDDAKLAQAITDIIREEMYGPAERLRKAPPQPSVAEWTQLEIEEDAAGLATRLAEYMEQSGMPRAEAQSKAFAFAQEIAQKERTSWGSFVSDLQQAPASSALNVAFDLMARVYELKEAARRAVDILSLNAVESGSDAIWKIKWDQTQKVYTKLSDDVQALFADAGSDLRRVLNGEEVPRRYQWDAAVKRYLDWDEQTFRDARATELGGVADTDRALWQKVIDANRAFVDRQYVLMFESFRKYPSLEALDVLRSTMKQVDVEGGKAAAFLQPLRDELGAAYARKARNFGELKVEYQRIRNAVWNRLFDNQASYVLGGTQAIVADGIGKKNAMSLRWQPDNIFEGYFREDNTPTTYVLVGATERGTLAGYDLTRNIMEDFAYPGGIRKAPLLPKELGPQLHDYQIQRILADDPTLAKNNRRVNPEKVTIRAMADKQGKKGWPGKPPRPTRNGRRLQTPPKPLTPESIQWTDEQGVHWTMNFWDADLSVWYAVNDAGQRRAFIEYESAGGMPAVPQEVYDNWLRITDQVQQRAAIDAEVEQLTGAAQAAPVTRVNAGQETPESVTGVNIPEAPVSPQTGTVLPASQVAGEAPTVDGGQLQLQDAWWADLPEELQEKLQRGLPIVEPVTVVPQPVPPYLRGRFRADMMNAYGLMDEAQGDVLMALADARAAVWARQTGRAAVEWYPAHIADVRRGGDTGTGALFQRMNLDTPEFRNWFGDSVVRNQDGTPKVMYHGSPSGTFDAFDVTRQDANALYGPGFYFTENPDVAGGWVEGGVMSWYEFVRNDELEAGLARARQFEPDGRIDVHDIEGLTDHKRIVAYSNPRVQRPGYAWRRDEVVPVEMRQELTDEVITGERYRNAIRYGNWSKTEAEYLERILKDFEKTGNVRMLELAQDQPYLLPVRDILTRRGIAGPGGTYPVHLSINNPVDMDAVLTYDDVKEYMRNLFGFARKNNIQISTEAYPATAIAHVLKTLSGDVESGRPITWASLYSELNYRLGQTAGRTITDWLKSEGFDGITHIGGAVTGTKPHRVYIAFEPTQIKSAIANQGTYDPANPSMLKQGPQGTPKGSTEFLDDNRAILRGLVAPDFSTAVHELAHVFRRDLADVAKVDAAAADDLVILEAWAGAKGGNWTVESEEKVARAFERYLAEGRAPTPALQSAFDRMKRWLAQIYRALKDIISQDKMSPQVRGVFDRLLADVPDVTKPSKELQDLIAWGEEAGIRGEYTKKDGTERVQINHLLNAINRAAEDSGLGWKLPGVQSVDAWIQANPREYQQAIGLLRERAGRLWNEYPTGERLEDLAAEFEQRVANLQALLEMYRQRLAEGLSYKDRQARMQAKDLRDLMRRVQVVQEQLDAQNSSLTALMVRQGEEVEIAEAVGEVAQETQLLNRRGQPLRVGDAVKIEIVNYQVKPAQGSGQIRYTIVDAVPDRDGKILVRWEANGKSGERRLAYDNLIPEEAPQVAPQRPIEAPGSAAEVLAVPETPVAAAPTTEAPRIGGEFALEDAVTTAQGSGSIVGVNRRNGQLRSYDVQLDSGEMLDDVPAAEVRAAEAVQEVAPEPVLSPRAERAQRRMDETGVGATAPEATAEVAPTPRGKGAVVQTNDRTAWEELQVGDLVSMRATGDNPKSGSLPWHVVNNVPDENGRIVIEWRREGKEPLKRTTDFRNVTFDSRSPAAPVAPTPPSIDATAPSGGVVAEVQGARQGETTEALTSQWRDVSTRFMQKPSGELADEMGRIRALLYERGINADDIKPAPRSVTEIQREIDSVQKRIDKLHEGYKPALSGGTRRNTTTYNANVGKLTDSMRWLEDELKRAQEYEAAQSPAPAPRVPDVAQPEAKVPTIDADGVEMGEYETGALYVEYRGQRVQIVRSSITGDWIANRVNGTASSGYTTKENAISWARNHLTKDTFTPTPSEAQAAKAPVTVPARVAPGDNRVAELVQQIDAYPGGYHAPGVVRLRQELGGLIAPGVRPGDADAAAEVYLNVQRGVATQAELDAYLSDLWRTNRIQGEQKAAFAAKYPNLVESSSAADVISDVPQGIRDIAKADPERVIIARPAGAEAQAEAASEFTEIHLAAVGHMTEPTTGARVTITKQGNGKWQAKAAKGSASSSASLTRDQANEWARTYLRKQRDAAMPPPKPKAAQAPQPTKVQTPIGKSRTGEQLFEDENGVRSYVTASGIRVNEPVAVTPRRGGMSTGPGDVSARDDKFRLESEPSLYGEPAPQPAAPAEEVDWSHREAPQGPRVIINQSDWAAEDAAAQAAKAPVTEPAPWKPVNLTRETYEKFVALGADLDTLKRLDSVANRPDGVPYKSIVTRVMEDASKRMGGQQVEDILYGRKVASASNYDQTIDDLAKPVDVPPESATIEAGGIDNAVPGTEPGAIEESDVGALAGIPAEDVRAVEEFGGTGGRGAGSVGTDVEGVPGVPESGSARLPGVGVGEERVLLPAERGANAELGDAGDGTLPGRAADQPGRGRGRGFGDAEQPQRTTLSTPSASRYDYVITEADDLENFGGPKTRWQTNLTAVKLLKKIESEGRSATPEEQRILARFSGWGLSDFMQGPLRSWGPDYWEKNNNRWPWAEEWKEIRELLTDEELKAAQAAGTNSHFTSPTVVNAMWSILEHMGLGNLPVIRMLEPAGGAGNMLGLMPTHLAARAQRTAVEMDSLTGRILAQLYQNANVLNMPYQATPLPSNYFNLAISNVPFADVGVSDPKFNGPKTKFLTSAIHNYYFAKALDQVEPGGVVAFITSANTMNAPTTRRTRQYLADRAEFLGAIRLPNTAFKGNAGTEVVTDVIFLRKLAPGEVSKNLDWVTTVNVKMDEVDYPVNRYFVNNPEMILGKQAPTGTMYGPKQYNVEKTGDLAEQLEAIKARFPENILRQSEIETDTAMDNPLAILRNRKVAKNNGYTVVDGQLKRRVGDSIIVPKVDPNTEVRIRGMLEIRDSARNVLEVMARNGDDKELKAAQKILDGQYNKYVKKYGALNASENRLAIAGDPDGYFIQGLEVAEGEGRKIIYTKSGIFSKRVMQGYTPATSAASASDALVLSLRERNRFDLEHMINLTGKTEAALIEELGDRVYRDPMGSTYVVAEDYLSGNVRSKLRQAEEAARVDPHYKRNVDALKAALPPDVAPSDISVRLGVGWIPPEMYAQFATEMIGSTPTVKYIEATAQWIVEGWAREPFSLKRKAELPNLGTDRVSASELFEDAMNARKTQVFDPPEERGEKPRLNKDATLAAAGAQEDMHDKFAQWLWADGQRADAMSKLYNEQFNTDRLRDFDGSHLTFPGMNPELSAKLYDHQRGGIWRGLQTGNMMLAHEVGAGKTFTMIGLGMEMKRTGLSKKNLYVVPKDLVPQWEKDFRYAYPGASILSASKDDFTPENRNRFMSRIATNDWDAVVISYEQFRKLPPRPETVTWWIGRQLDELQEILAEVTTRSGKSKTEKEIQKAIKRLETKIQKKLADVQDRDNTVFWEDLGVTAMFVDEADNFKNLYFPTRRSRVAGLPQSDSERAFDMFIKVQELTKRNNGRGVVFATGTPIANSIAEAFTMMRYLDYDGLQSRGLQSFDAWANHYAQDVTALEMSPDGSGFRMKTRFSRFNNIPELSKMLQRTFDIKQAKELNLKRPKLKGGKPIIVKSERTDALSVYINGLANRTDLIRSGKVKPEDDNMLKVTGDGRKASLHIQMMVPGAPEAADSKINNAVANVIDIYQRTNADKGTQIIWADLGTPRPKGQKKKKNEVIEIIEDVVEDAEDAGVEVAGATVMAVNAAEERMIYEIIKRRLIEGGIPAEEIAFVQEATTKAKKAALAAATNRGDIRVVIASTQKMGAGWNVQERLYGMHHLDVPWRPRDVEQRNGRQIRPGNMYDEVERYHYVQEPFDAYSWDVQMKKSRAINSLMTRDPQTRSIIDSDEFTLNAAEMMAIASGDPAVMRRAEVDAALTKQRVAYASWENKKIAWDRELAQLPGEIRRTQQEIEVLKIGDAWAKTQPMELSIAGNVYKPEPDTKKMAKAFWDAADAFFTTPEKEAQALIGTLRGFDVYATKTPSFIKGGFHPSLLLVRDNKVLRSWNIELNAEGHPKHGIFTDALDETNYYANQLAWKNQSLRKDQTRLAEMQGTVFPPYEKEAEYKALLAEMKEIELRLGQRGDEEAALRQAATRQVESEAARQAEPEAAVDDLADEMDEAEPGDEGLTTMYGGLGMVPPIDWRTMFGARNLDDVKRRANDIGDTIRKYWRKPKQQEMGDVSLHQVRTLEDAHKRIMDSLPGLAKPKDGTLPAAVQKDLMDRVDRILLPAHDNAVYGALKSAQSAADGAMLNYQDRRGVDTLMSYIFPFSYYWTRGGAQWAKRLARHPAYANMLYETQRQVNASNDRNDIPSRLKGTIFVRQGKDGKYYLRNPMEWLLPSYLGMPNRFDNPDQARGPAERAWLQLQQMTPGFNPIPDAMMAFGMDAMYGVKPGEHGALADYTTRGFVPLLGIAMDARQAMTGDAADALTGGDRFNQYRVRRSIGVQAEQQQFNEQDRMAAQYARQIALNLEQGKERYTDVPEEFKQRADEIYREASKQAGKERLLTSATGWGLGNSAYYVPDAEMDLQRQNQEYQAAGYSEANPAGSAEARRAVLEANPNVPLTWGNSVTEGERTPAQSAEQSRMYSDLEKNVYGPEAEEITKAITDALAAGKGDKEIGVLIADIKEKYYDLGQEVRAAYPNQPPAGLGGPASGSNPWEQAIDQLTDILSTPDLAYPEYPGDNATQAQKDEYYRLRTDYYNQKASLIAKRIDAAMYTSQMDAKASESDLILSNLLRQVPVNTLEREFKKLKYASEAEVNWKRAADARTAEITNAMVTMFGDARMKEFEHYNSLTGEARSKYNDDKPYLAAMSVMTYHPDEYRRAIETFGEDAWLAWANRPVGEKGAYYDQYPDAFLVNAWVYGRYDDALGTDLQKLASSTGDVYDFGKDYEEAMRKFGDDIWKIVTDYSSSWSKKQKSAYIKAHQVITDFWDWWYGPKDTGDSYRSGYYRSNYSRYYKRYSRRSYGGYGGYSRSSYGGYGGGGGGYTPYVRMPEVWNREMDKNLRRDYVRNPYEFAPVAGTGPYWMEAGENLKPGRAPEVERWQPRRVWK